MHLRTIVKPLPKCSQHVTNEMQPNTSDRFVERSVRGSLGALGSSILLLEVTLKRGTLVFVCGGCYRMLSTPLNTIIVTTKPVIT